jgi:hypothetical protein
VSEGQQVAKVRDEVFTHFHAVATKVTVVCRIDCLACQDEFFVNNPLDVKENVEHALDFDLQPVTVSGVVELMGLPVCWLSSMDVRPALN